MEKQSTFFELLKPSIYLAGMLARSGNFPPEYLAGFESLVEDMMARFPSEELSDGDKQMIRSDIKKIISASRLKAGLE